MSYIYFNPNPEHKNIGDCAVRAFCMANDCDWETSYIKIILRGFSMRDMPSADNVWGSQLQSEGFTYHILPNTCPFCYTVRDFCVDNPKGTFVLGTGTPAAADDYFNVTSTAIITVPRGCCFNLSVENVSEAEGATPAPAINVQNANLVIQRIS